MKEIKHLQLRFAPNQQEVRAAARNSAKMFEPWTVTWEFNVVQWSYWSGFHEGINWYRAEIKKRRNDHINKQLKERGERP